MSHLSQLMVILIQFNPELVKSTLNDVLLKQLLTCESLHDMVGCSGSISSHKSIVAISQNLTKADFGAEGDNDEVQAGHNFTYIHPNPKM
jgi:hypothetical protein